MEVLKDGMEAMMELHLASFCLADSELHLEGTDDPAFAVLKVKYADVLGGGRRACRRTAAWSSSSRRAAHRCRGHGG